MVYYYIDKKSKQTSQSGHCKSNMEVTNLLAFIYLLLLLSLLCTHLVQINTYIHITFINIHIIN